MRYLCLIYHDEAHQREMTKAEADATVDEYHEFVATSKESGHYLADEALRCTETATTLRLRRGKRVVTDGPFMESREQLGGYFLIEARDLDDAIGVAARIPAARSGAVEIRPVRERSDRDPTSCEELEPTSDTVTQSPTNPRSAS